MTKLVDLHRHLEGSIRPTTAHAMARRNGLPTSELPLVQAKWRSAFVSGDREGDLLPYLAKIDNASSFATRLEDWRRITDEAMADAADDGLDAVEFRFSPEFIHLMTGLNPDAVIETIRDTVAESPLALEVGLIGIILRNAGPDAAVEQMRRLLRHADCLVGVDLAGDEAGHPAALFRHTFDLAHDQGMPVTIHAGEAAGPKSVWDALEHLHARRIGHGVRSAEDPRLLDALAEREITLEVAITSNLQTGAAPNLQAHQIARLVEAGVPVALCTDNPAVSNTRLTWEYHLATQVIPADAVAAVRRRGLEARFSV